MSKELTVGELGRTFHVLDQYLSESRFSGGASGRFNKLRIWHQDSDKYNTLGFDVRLTQDQWLQMIDTGAQNLVIQECAGKLSTASGMSAARDGQQRYEIAEARVRLERNEVFDNSFYNERRPLNMEVFVEVIIGGPDGGNWYHGREQDRSGEKYWIHFVLPWTQLFEFFDRSDEQFVSALRTSISRNIGLEIE